MKLMLFVSSGCPHCPKAEAAVSRVLPEYSGHGVEFEKVRTRTSEGKELSARYGIRGLPTILMIDDEGNELKRIVGAPSDDNLKGKIEGALGLKKGLFSRVFGGRK